MNDRDPIIAFLTDDNILKSWEYERYLREGEIDAIIDEWQEEGFNVRAVWLRDETDLNQYRNSQDIAEKIGNELEDANHHRTTGVPYEVHCILKEYLNEDQLKEVFIKFHKQNTFMGD